MTSVVYGFPSRALLLQQEEIIDMLKIVILRKTIVKCMVFICFIFCLLSF